LKANADGAEGDAPTDVEFLPDGLSYLIAHRDSSNLIEFDATTDAFLREIPLSSAAQSLAVSSDGTAAYVGLIFEDAVAKVDLASGIEQILATGIGLPGTIGVTADGSRVAIADLATQELVVLDAVTGAELSRIGGMGFATQLSFAPEPGAVSLGVAQLGLFGSGMALHPDYFNAQIEVLDLVAGTSTVLPSASNPRGFAITPDGTTAVVAHNTFNGVDQVISVLDLTVPQIVKTIDLGQNVGSAIAIDPTGTSAVVAVQNACVVVDLINDTVGPNLNTASINELYTTADGQFALGVGFRGPLISFASGTVVQELNNVVSTAFGAVSPIAPKGVMVSTTFGEDRVVVDTAGALGGLQLVDGTGEPLEADATRRAAVSTDGTRAVTTNILSDTATVWDVASGEPLAVLTVGNRPSDVEITPDGSQAVVANLDSTFASVIDMNALTVTNVPISTRASEVEIAPDGQFAYVAVLASGDGVWRIDLSTLTQSGGKLATGNMGSISFPYTQTSGMELSPDGAFLAVCGSFDDNVTLIDTAAWAVDSIVSVGDFPVRATWSPNSSRVYVSNRDSDTIRPVRRLASGFVALAPISVGQWPYEGRVSPDGSTLYVIEYLDEAVGVVDLVSSTKTATIPINETVVGLELAPDGSAAFVATGSYTATLGGGDFEFTDTGDLVVLDTATNTVLQTVNNDWSPAGLVADPAGTVLVVPTPRGDGLGVVRLDQALVASVDSISIAAGGSQDLCIDLGAAQASDFYLVIGSASGTTPGFPAGSVLVPLNVDAYSLLTINQTGIVPFLGFFGVLDALGEGQASFLIPAGAGISPVSLAHAAVALDPVTAQVSAATNAVGVQIVD
ncbi:MAG: hypothetical protein AAFZ65_15020, partial [Planctomycetota bacterium]